MHELLELASPDNKDICLWLIGCALSLDLGGGFEVDRFIDNRAYL